MSSRLVRALCALGAAAGFSLTISEARPVSYPEAWTVQTFNEAERNALLIHYTTTPKAAYGLRIEDRGYDDHVFYGGQHNRLLKRWNAPDSQANLYLKLGAGVAAGDFNTGDSESKAAGFAQVAADWENRHLFFSAAAGTYAFEGAMMTEQSARIGVAPYAAEFGALHTWVMVQVDHRPDADETLGAEELTVTPLLRFFKGPALMEIGYSSNDEPLFNFTYRF